MADFVAPPSPVGVHITPYDYAGGMLKTAMAAQQATGVQQQQLALGAQRAIAGYIGQNGVPQSPEDIARAVQAVSSQGFPPDMVIGIGREMLANRQQQMQYDMARQGYDIVGQAMAGQPASALQGQPAVPGQTPMGAPSSTPQGGGNVPLTVRNNNPGAIMPNGQAANYGSPQEGAQALNDLLLRRYTPAQGITNLNQLFATYAPAGHGDNNPQAYAATIGKMLGVDPNAPIDITNPQFRSQLMAGIAQVEGGPRANFTQDIFDQAAGLPVRGVQLAQNGPYSVTDLASKPASILTGQAASGGGYGPAVQGQGVPANAQAGMPPAPVMQSPSRLLALAQQRPEIMLNPVVANAVKDAAAVIGAQSPQQKAQLDLWIEQSKKALEAQYAPQIAGATETEKLKAQTQAGLNPVQVKKGETDIAQATAMKDQAIKDIESGSQMMTQLNEFYKNAGGAGPADQFKIMVARMAPMLGISSDDTDSMLSRISGEGSQLAAAQKAAMKMMFTQIQNNPGLHRGVAQIMDSIKAQYPNTSNPEQINKLLLEGWKDTTQALINHGQAVLDAGKTGDVNAMRDASAGFWKSRADAAGNNIEDTMKARNTAPPEGSRVKGPDGKIYVVKGGQPVLE